MPFLLQIAYVLGTEDFFHRKRGKKAAMDKAARQQRFGDWFSKQTPALAAA
jgi:hypothetical protein